MIIDDKDELKKIIRTARQSGKSVLVKKGVFDIIHPGHIFAIQQFHEKADIIIVLIQSDEFTRNKKGIMRPINNQNQRMEVIDGMKGVDYVFADTSNSRDEYLDFLRFLEPTIVAITKGDLRKSKDYSSTLWKLMEFPDKKKKEYSTTRIINSIIKKYSDNL